MEKNLKELFELEYIVKSEVEGSSDTRNNSDFFVVSSIWIEAFLKFISRMKKIYLIDENAVTQENQFSDDNIEIENLSDEKKKMRNKVYERNLMLRIFYSANLGIRPKENFGYYPGPIANYHLVEFLKPKSSVDTANISTDCYEVFMKGNLSEKEDFVFISEDTYLRLKGFFSSLFDIRRSFISINDTSIIETSLLKLKIIIFGNEEIKTRLNDSAVPGYFQFSKTSTWGSLNEKIISNLKLDESIKLKIYRPKVEDKNDKQQAIFSAMSSYYNDNSKHIFKGDELLFSEEATLGVSKLYLTN